MYVIFELYATEEGGTGVALATAGTVQVLSETITTAHMIHIFKIRLMERVFCISYNHILFYYIPQGPILNILGEGPGFRNLKNMHLCMSPF